MPERQRKRRTILHFSCNRRVLIFRGWFLDSVGYRVLNSSNGFEAIELSTRKRVDAVVLDLDQNQTEVTVIVQQIKRLRPTLPTIVLTEGMAPVDGVRELADALVPKEHGVEPLVESLEKLLSAHDGAVVQPA